MGPDADGGTMTQNHQFAILYPLVVGVGAVACTIFVHALALAATVNLFRHERKVGRAGAGALMDLAIVALATSFAFVAHLIEIALWAVLLIACGEFQGFANAFYHSAVNYTTLGYGDLLMTPSVAVVGTIGGGERSPHVRRFTTAMLFAVIQRLLLTRFEDLRYSAFRRALALVCTAAIPKLCHFGQDEMSILPRVTRCRLNRSTQHRR